MPNKLNELNAIASFGQASRIDGFSVSVETAKVILSFYSRLPHGLRRNYLSLPVDRMAGIAYQKLGLNPNGATFTLQPSLAVMDQEISNLRPVARDLYVGARVFEKKYVNPFVAQREKDFQKFLKKHKIKGLFV